MVKKFSLQAKKDYELVKRAREEGDQDAYAQLMGRYKDSVYYVLLRMVYNEEDAEDLTMEAFGKAFNNLEKYDPNYSFSTWFYRIAINNAIDFIRKKKRAKSSSDKTVSLDKPINTDEGDTIKRTLEGKNPDPERQYIKEQRKEMIRKVVEQMTDRHRKLIELRYFNEYSYKEIAKELDKPLGTIKAQLYRAREVLNNILDQTKDKY